ncbi:MAG: nitroreductase/quinone reductase family protein [Chloroflexota bacterium]
MTSVMIRIANRVLKPLLRSPLHFFASQGVMLITFTGKKSGKVYITPVQYRQDGEVVSFFTRRDRIWWKNLRGGAPVTLRLRGHDRHGQAIPLEDLPEQHISARLRVMYPRASDERIARLSQHSLPVEVILQADEVEETSRT